MADDFNPYQLWLGLPPSLEPPDHYSLLGLEQGEVDSPQVRRAADVRKSRVRGCRPGEHVAAWSQLLDELEKAQRCLSDPALKAEYDTQLRSRNAEPAAIALEVASVRNLLPPVWPAESPNEVTGPNAQCPTVLSAVPTPFHQQAPIQANPTSVPSMTALQAMPIDGTTLSPETNHVEAAIHRETLSNLVVGPASDTLTMQNLGHEFVVPQVAPTGAAAQLLPPPVMAMVTSPGLAVSMPVLAPQPPTAPWTSPAASHQPSAPSAPAAALYSRSPTPSTNRTSPWTPAAVISVVGIGLAILMLAGAIMLVWRARHDESASLNTKTGVTTSGLPKSENHPSPLLPKSEPKPPIDPRALPVPQPSPPPAEQPKPNPVPVPVPEPSPAPKPEPSALPKPSPEPMAPPIPPSVAPTPEQTRLVQVALLKARQLLSDREPTAAMAVVKEAQQLAGEGPLKATIAPTESLSHFVNEFWTAVGAALPKLAGSEIEVGDTRVFVIETGQDRILIRWAGKNREFTRKTMPAGLARKIAENWLEKTPASKVIIGAFLVVDPTMLENSGREKARRLWSEAAAGGADVGELLKVLSEPGP